VPNFVYTARDQQGRVQKNSSKAGSSRDLISRLRGQGLTIMQIQQRKGLSSIGLFQPRVKVDDIAVFSRQFATMSGAGVPITECLDVLVNQTENPTLSKAITEVKTEVEGGGGLADALAKHPKIFSKLYVSMVRAGEATGAYEVVLNQLATLSEKQRDLKNKVKSAIFLPIVVLSFCLLITLGLLVFIVPKFAALFEEMDAQLPYPTQVLIGISQGIRGPMGIIAVASVFLLVLIIKKVISTEKGRYAWDKIKLKLPLFGSLVTKKVVASFARIFGLLDVSGVPILEALDIVAEAAGNSVVASAIRRARDSIQQGESISKPLAESQIFPPMVTHMIVVGENTGSVETMLTKIAELYEDDVDRSVESLTRLIEPLMMTVIGAIVGSILICLYMPIFNLASAIE